ncbi:DUF6197 family protein [Micromonospora musae]|uniref:DUF6197 family protein n=1 Tax=Micromonospora musae TaxID=1894970 RepID=UPI00343A3EF0
MKATHNSPTTVQVTPADLLRMAAVYLRRHGWTQGDYYTVVFDALTPRACASGALSMAAYGTTVDLPYATDRPEQADYRAAQRVLMDYLGVDSTSGLFLWNDTPGRTAGEVITAFEAAADEWDRLHTEGGENR